MNSKDLRQTFLKYFEEKRHKIIPSSSLIPGDNTVLFTTAGMQQLSPYLAGKKDVLKDFQNRHLCSCQKCFRTGDIEEIGDDTHNTFFEMLGNWSIGQDQNGYFKEGAIEYALDFLVNKLGLDKNRFHITVFKGNSAAPKDIEAIEIWTKHGIPQNHIYEFGENDNFWGPVSETGPCGPCSEIHYDRGEEYGCRNTCGPNCDYCKRFVEIWNLVFMEYYKNEAGNYEKLNQTNIDTGIGFERLLSILQGKSSAYETDLFQDLILEIEKYSKVKYDENKEAFRIVADHLRGTSFLIAEGIIPSNSDRGYILRRLLRRIVRYARLIELDLNYAENLFSVIINKYIEVYPELKANRENIFTVSNLEKEKFEKTLEKGLKELDKLTRIDSENAFFIYQTFGFPIEMIKEEAEKKGIKIDEEGFREKLRKHQEISRAGALKKFGGVGVNAGAEEAKLHTATHLLHQALREVLGEHVKQMGSNIDAERLRFDFSHNAKLGDEEIKEVEDIVNERIQKGFVVEKEVKSLKEALESNALAFFKEKYPDNVNVYTIKNPETGKIYSKEICAGPHAESSKDLGKFKIQKESSSSSGVRRIKAILIY
ncbi:MAG: alanine--tRNA ligase [Candidatus Pacebacteria bacterium]|nr:alanine--tRNA ligase [Candidatus Paceibacterota bacterium]